MKCEIIKDLIPLAGEGLCSEESEKLIAEHIAGCENCRMLYEKVPETAAKVAVPDETDTFEKVHSLFKRLTRKMLIMCVIMSIILGITLYLSAGQMTRGKNMRSFETILQNMEVRTIAGYIADGDFERYIHTIPYQSFTYEHDSINAGDDMDELSVQLLKDTYNAAYGDTKVKKIKVKSSYDSQLLEFPSDNIVQNRAEIIFEDGRSLVLYFFKQYDGCYQTRHMFEASCWMLPKEQMTEEELAFMNALVYVNDYDLIEGSTVTMYITYPEEAEVYNGLFQPQYHDRVRDGKAAFVEKGCRVSEAYTSDYHYDAEKKMLYRDLSIKAEMGDDTAFMSSRLYYTYAGLIPPEKEDIQVYGNNDVLKDAMMGFFG